MYRPALCGASCARVLSKAPVPAARRFLSTAPPHKKSRSWKSTVARWGLAGTLVYYYNTASVFSDEPAQSIHAPPETTRENEVFQTLDAVAEQRKAAQARAKAREVTPEPSSAPSTPASATPSDAAHPKGASPPDSPEDLEQEAAQQGAFNEETGEINWDCPCLGGMADGPCGEQFKAAFSCFVFSKEEPKGVDCIENFKTMQNCFRDHPEIYGSELDEDEVEGQLAEQDRGNSIAPTEAGDRHLIASEKREPVGTMKEPVERDANGAGALVPKAAHDAR